MRIDLPCCGFKNCRLQFDGNCTAPKHVYESCEITNSVERGCYGCRFVSCGVSRPDFCDLCARNYSDGYSPEVTEK